MNENVTHPIPCPESSSTSSHMHMPSAKNQTVIMFHQWSFFKTKAFCFIHQNPLDGSRYRLAFPMFRVFMHLWAMDFPVYTAGRHMPFQYFYDLSPPVIMSNRECRVFHPRGRGIYPNLLCPTHIFFIFKTVRLMLDVVPCYRAYHRTLNTVSINHVPTTYHRTPNTVSITTMHSHPTQFGVPMHMKCSYAIPCLYHAIYMMSAI